MANATREILERLTFRCVIIGAGPAGIAPLIHAARSQVLPDLLSGSDSTNRGGILLVDSAPLEEFGCGNLGRYLIPSRASPEKFHVTPVVCTKKSNAGLVHECVQGSCLEPLLSAQKSENAMSAICNSRERSIALTTVGEFMQQVGALLVKAFAMSPHSFLLERSRCEGVVVLANGDFALQIRCYGADDPSLRSAEGLVEIRAKSVVLATGGSQRMPKSLRPNDDCPGQRVFLSCEVMQPVGLRQLVEHIVSTGCQKIVVHGSGHSAYSVVWLLLNAWDVKAASSFPHFLAGDIPRITFGDGDITVVAKTTAFVPLSDETRILYQRMVSKTEPRARLLVVQPSSVASPEAPKSPKVQSGADAAPSPRGVATAAVRSSMSLIWAGGYTTNLPPVWQEPEQCPPNHKKSASAGAGSTDTAHVAQTVDLSAGTMNSGGGKSGRVTDQDECGHIVTCRGTASSRSNRERDGKADASAQPLPRTKAVLLMAAHEKVRVDNSGRITITNRKRPCELYGIGVGFGHADDFVDGIGTFITHRGRSMIQAISGGKYDRNGLSRAKSNFQAYQDAAAEKKRVAIERLKARNRDQMRKAREEAAEERALMLQQQAAATAAANANKIKKVAKKKVGVFSSEAKRAAATDAGQRSHVQQGSDAVPPPVEDSKIPRGAAKKKKSRMLSRPRIATRAEQSDKNASPSHDEPVLDLEKADTDLNEDADDATVGKAQNMPLAEISLVHEPSKLHGEAIVAEMNGRLPSEAETKMDKVAPYVSDNSGPAVVSTTINIYHVTDPAPFKSAVARRKEKKAQRKKGLRAKSKLKRGVQNKRHQRVSATSASMPEDNILLDPRFKLDLTAVAKLAGASVDRDSSLESQSHRETMAEDACSQFEHPLAGHGPEPSVIVPDRAAADLATKSVPVGAGLRAVKAMRTSPPSRCGTPKRPATDQHHSTTSPPVHDEQAEHVGGLLSHSPGDAGGGNVSSDADLEQQVSARHSISENLECEREIAMDRERLQADEPAPTLVPKPASCRPSRFTLRNQQAHSTGLFAVLPATSPISVGTTVVHRRVAHSDAVEPKSSAIPGSKASTNMPARGLLGAARAGSRSLGQHLRLSFNDSSRCKTGLDMGQPGPESSIESQSSQTTRIHISNTHAAAQAPYIRREGVGIGKFGQSNVVDSRVMKRPAQLFPHPIVHADASSLSINGTHATIVVGRSTHRDHGVRRRQKAHSVPLPSDW